MGQNEVELRKAQENLVGMLDGGFHKDYARWVVEMWREFIQLGCSPAEACDLLVAVLRGASEPGE